MNRLAVNRPGATEAARYRGSVPLTDAVPGSTERARCIALVGPMGSGKSAVGQALAERTGRRFVDTDVLVEHRAGRSVATIFAEDGEEAFRALEREAVAHALAGAEPAVVATGGGAVLEAPTRRLLADRAVVVWLTAPSRVLAARVGPGADRPLLAGRDAAAVLDEIAIVRGPLYAEVADIELDTSTATPDELVSQIVELLGVGV